MKQSAAFLNESTNLYDVLRGFECKVMKTKTKFKGWSFNDIIRHLHFWNIAADLSLRQEVEFLHLFNQVKTFTMSGTTREFERTYLDNLSGANLLETWYKFSTSLKNNFAGVDPKTRVTWAGPSMSALSSITARYMETWAHSQAIYDALGIERSNTDDIYNIVVLGKNTYNWSFANRGLKSPQPMPSLTLSAPSGKIWSFGDKDEANHISGQAEEFCQVVTQVRNILDVDLEVIGAPARHWMEIAQCFAGPVENPPSANTRIRTRK